MAAEETKIFRVMDYDFYVFGYYFLQVIYFMIIVPFGLCFFFAKQREINPWGFAILALFISYLSVIILVIAYRTPKQIAKRQRKIEAELERLQNKK